VLGASIQFIAPSFVDAKEGCVHFQSAAAWMIGAFNLKAFAVVDAARDFEDHDVVEEVGAGEAEAVVTAGLSEMGIMLVIVCVCHIVIGFQ